MSSLLYDVLDYAVCLLEVRSVLYTSREVLLSFTIH